MAEGLANHDFAKHWVAYSAGTEPSGYVHPLAISVMAELGIDISGQISKPVIDYREMNLDLIVTVCDDAAENCPVWLGRGRTMHMGFDDPANSAGSELERLAVFRRVRDEIRTQLSAILSPPL
jgi:arsenate reductase